MKNSQSSSERPDTPPFHLRVWITFSKGMLQAIQHHKISHVSKFQPKLPTFNSATPGRGFVAKRQLQKQCATPQLLRLHGQTSKTNACRSGGQKEGNSFSFGETSNSHFGDLAISALLLSFWHNPPQLRNASSHSLRKKESRRSGMLQAGWWPGDAPVRSLLHHDARPALLYPEGALAH